MSFIPDSRTAMLDLVFLLFGFFFVTTVIGVRAPSVTDEVSDRDTLGPFPPVVVRIEGFAPQPRFGLISAGAHAEPAVGQGLDAWLRSACDRRSTTVEVGCPPDATHRQCKRGLIALKRQAPDCRYRY